MEVETIILDFDGTIVESVGIKDRAFELLFQKYPDQLERIMHYHRSHNATIRYEKFRYITETILHQRYNATIERRLSKQCNQLVFQQIVGCPYVTGAKEFLDYFYEKIPLYLISMTPLDEFINILRARHLDRYFTNVYAYPWNKKESIRDIIVRGRFTPNHVVFIGDTSEDCDVALDAQLMFVGRSSGRPFHRSDVPILQNLLEIKQYLIENIHKKG